MRRQRGLLSVAAVTLLAGAALSACGSDGGDAGDGGGVTTAVPATQASSTQVTAVRVGTLAEPTALVVRAGDDRLWAAERAGTIRQVTVASDGTLSPSDEVALDLTDQTTTEAERGLLDIVFSEDGGTLYVSHTDPDGNTRVASYRVDDDGVDAGSRTVLLAEDQPFPNHNGGNLELGPDGEIWFGFGDGGAADDPENRAQDPSTPLGKIVRVDPDGGDPEIVISGVRNPWRFSFDTDGSLWIGDVGQNKTEEVDHLPAGQIDGANLGWSGFEGSTPYLDGDGRRPSDEDATPPVYEYSHDDGNCSITGGVVYRGTAFPSLAGTYLFADYCKGDVFAVQLPDDGTKRGARAIDLEVHVDQPISFGSDDDGEPYVLSQTGAVIRLQPKV